MKMRFPIQELMSEEACYERLLEILHSGGMRCPEGHRLPEEQAPHTRKRSPVDKYKCRQCGSVFDIFTGTVWSGTHATCVTVLLVMRGFVQGTPTQQLADELNLDYGTLLERRHRVQEAALSESAVARFFDSELEADELYQNAGEKGDLHPHPSDPPRRRANKRRGRGTMANDRPPILGIWGRTSGQVRFIVCENTTQATIVPLVVVHTRPWSTLYTDECNAYNPISATGRAHSTVCHSRREWARDDDGDGVREVHCNSMEGIWTGLRNFLRPFRGVHKRYLAQYVAMFEWTHNLKFVTDSFLRLLMNPHFTYFPT